MEERIAIIKSIYKINDKYEIIQYLKILENIPTERLIEFSVYSLQNKLKYETEKACIVRTAKNFSALITLNLIRQNMFRFENLEEFIHFVKTNFKEKEITNGNSENGFLPFVILSIDKDGDLYSKYTMSKASNYETIFFKWLFKNQEKLGQIERISYSEYLNIEEENKKRKKIESEIENTAQEIENKQKIQNQINKLLERKKV